jgi:hypothetical protein
MEIKTATAKARLMPRMLIILDLRPGRMDLRLNILFTALGVSVGCI